MKNKGFTLVELLAVIILLALIALIAIPAIVGVLREGPDNISEAQQKNIEAAARNWASEPENMQHLPPSGTEQCTNVTLARLQRDGFADMEIINPGRDTVLVGSVTISYRERSNTPAGQPTQFSNQLVFEWVPTPSVPRSCLRNIN